MSKPTFPEIFSQLEARQNIDAETLRGVFDAILAGAWANAQIGGLLVALRLAGETPEQIAAAVEAMRAVMVPLAHRRELVLDTAGTGGDQHGTVNLSTGAAIIAAADGIAVAKHGNRAVSSLAGSADVLSALGVPIDLTPEQAASAFNDAGAVFLMAPLYHPALKNVMPVRRELGVRTLFNALGPLGNPASATHQLLGAFDEALRPVFARTLLKLGTQRAWVVRGLDGLDEISPYAVTRVTELNGGEFLDFEVSPEAFGLERAKPGEARGGTPAENADTLLRVLRGEPHPARNAFLINAAGALVVARRLSLKDAALRARELVDSGAALKALERWKAASVRAKENATVGAGKAG